eukprot:10124710-Alexandrium_andersonii.AAC.1
MALALGSQSNAGAPRSHAGAPRPAPTHSCRRVALALAIALVLSCARGWARGRLLRRRRGAQVPAAH